MLDIRKLSPSELFKNDMYEIIEILIRKGY